MIVVMVLVLVSLVLVDINVPDVHNCLHQQKYQCYYEQNDEDDQKREKKLVVNPVAGLDLHLREHYAAFKSLWGHAGQEKRLEGAAALNALNLRKILEIRTVFLALAVCTVDNFVDLIWGLLTGRVSEEAIVIKTFRGLFDDLAAPLFLVRTQDCLFMVPQVNREGEIKKHNKGQQ